jgi:hypothetical protein
MEPEGSLPYSQVPATCPYPELIASEIRLHKLTQVRSVDWIFNIGVPAWWWLGKYVTLDKTFYNLVSKQEVGNNQVTSKISSLSNFSRRFH